MARGKQSWYAVDKKSGGASSDHFRNIEDTCVKDTTKGISDFCKKRRVADLSALLAAPVFLSTAWVAGPGCAGTPQTREPDAGADSGKAGDRRRDLGMTYSSVIGISGKRDVCGTLTSTTDGANHDVVVQGLRPKIP